MKKIAIFLFLIVLGTGQIKAQKDFVDSLVQGNQEIADFFAMIDASVDTSWYTRVDNTHLQGRLPEIFGPGGDQMFIQFVNATGGRAFKYEGSTEMPKDSVMSYYHNLLKTEDFDSIGYRTYSTTYDEDLAGWLGHKYCTHETYSFYKKGKRIRDISIYWEEKSLRGWSDEILTNNN